MSHQDGRYRVFVVAAKVLFLAALPFFAYGFGAQVLDLAHDLSLSASRSRSFLLGAAIFIPVSRLAKRLFWGPWQYVCTLEHELTHAAVGVPFLLFPHRVHITATRGGHVQQAWIAPLMLAPLYGPGRLLSGLAPYYLPTTSYALIALGILFVDPQRSWFSIALGFLTAFHIISTWAETSYRQPDLHEAGLAFSTLFLPVANLISLGGVLAFAVGGTDAFLRFWPDGFWRTVVAATKLASLFQSASHASFIVTS